MGSIPEKPAVDYAKDFNRYVQRLSEKEWDWSTFASQGEYDKNLERAQIRMVGGSITGVHDGPDVIPPEHFTVSFMNVPPGNTVPSHGHPDVEEAFFILEGEATGWWENPETGETFEAKLAKHDLIMSPAHVMHGLKNTGDTDLIVQVLIGSQTPEKPYYVDDGLAGSQYAVHGRTGQ
ncbi:MAG: cupin domain-containing protein [Actinomycetota bacterium]